MRRHRVVPPAILVAALVAAVTTSCGAPLAARESSSAATTATTATTTVTTAIPSGTPMGTPSGTPMGVAASAVTPDPRVGAIFLGGQSLHICSAAVLDSADGDLILTAAHCMATGVDAYFVPGFTNGAEPQAFWKIDEIYLDPRWVASQDPLADFAIVRVSHDGGGSVEAAAGGGFTLGGAPEIGTDVAVTGYALGVGGDPIGCTALPVARDHGYPSLRCSGLVDGTSGSPWTTGSTIVGVTGGLDGGGCEESVSYTPPFDDAITRLLARAEAAGPGDDAPPVFVDEC